ncbi:zinc finger (CCCH type) motif-containing protein [Cardiosporidium cionae]|uniref:Zinc finger (CCCH type) motif-containing protein n=1 Tax=Cardiosporidium cionae TaxID=476202 RepID=A0ABQ7JFN4_9APIC|nr:zinc finger (CCCH type) motif-containing protein [Cardiosporidium cionae]|eukprot:KAF8822690.1 zinc finger (CCCH type) motif-containing protein [Cardiosporidium cionae]
MFAKRNAQTNLRRKSSSSISVAKTCEEAKQDTLESAAVESDVDKVKDSDYFLDASTRSKSPENASDVHFVLEENSSATLKYPENVVKLQKLDTRKRTHHSTKAHARPLESSCHPYEHLGSYKGNRSLTLEDDQRATALFSVNTDTSSDHRSILERNASIGDAILSGELQEGIYRGKGAYKPILRRREGAIAAGKYTGVYGPVRGAESIRMTMRIDLNPEICKDYKETGYCGFGDTCKFLHDRSDYKAGWQLEKEWEDMQKQRQAKLQRLADRMHRQAHQGANQDNESPYSDASDSDGDEVPFACLICKEKWQKSVNPVVTTCGHYFCERCAFKHYSKSSKCATCGQQTCGIFNSAEKAIEKLISKRYFRENTSPVTASAEIHSNTIADSDC